MSAASGPAAVPARSRGGSDWPEVPARRKVANLLFWGVCFLGLAVVVVPTIWLAGGIVVRAVPTSASAC